MLKEDSMSDNSNPFAAFTKMCSKVETLHSSLESAINALNSRPPIVYINEDGWVDAKQAAKYLCISPSTFDKYRYDTTVKISGYPIDGKILYKKSDLDTWVRLYQVKTREVE